MSINSFSTLKTAVNNWLNRTDLSDYVNDFIMLGEARIYRELRIKAMETALSDTISSGVVAVPSDYLELKHAYINSSPTQPLQRKTAEWIYQKYPTRSADSVPKFIARDGDNFIFGPYPDSGYTLKGIYYAKLTALSTSNETNWFTSNAPDLLLWAALAEAEPFIGNDERAMLWETKYQQAKNAVESQDEKERHSGSVLAASVVWS